MDIRAFIWRNFGEFDRPHTLFLGNRFLDFDSVIPFSVFNIADMAICVAMGLYLIFSWNADRLEKIEKSSDEKAS